MRPTKPIKIEYYSQAVWDLIRKFPDGILQNYYHSVDLLIEAGAKLRMPHSRAMGNGLFELRPKGQEGVARVFYCRAPGHRIIILHAFIKKTEKTPRNELIAAIRRLREVNYGKRS